MIAAIIEVCLKADRKRHCLKIAADLKPLLEKVTMSALPQKADINRCLRHLGFALGDGRISLQVGTPSGSYVRGKIVSPQFMQRYCFSRPGPLKTNFSPGCPGSSGPFVICALQASHNLIISGPRRTVTASAQAVAHIAPMNFFILQPDGQTRLVPFSISPVSQQSLAQPAWLYRTIEHSCLLRVLDVRLCGEDYCKRPASRE